MGADQRGHMRYGFMSRLRRARLSLTETFTSSFSSKLVVLSLVGCWGMRGLFRLYFRIRQGADDYLEIQIEFLLSSINLTRGTFEDSLRLFSKDLFSLELSFDVALVVEHLLRFLVRLVKLILNLCSCDSDFNPSLFQLLVCGNAPICPLKLTLVSILCLDFGLFSDLQLLRFKSLLGDLFTEGCADPVRRQQGLVILGFSWPVLSLDFSISILNSPFLMLPWRDVCLDSCAKLTSEFSLLTNFFTGDLDGDLFLPGSPNKQSSKRE